jgi:hypothetical protein
MLKKCTKQLRGCLDSTFPYSKSIEFETDKIKSVHLHSKFEENLLQYLLIPQ